MVGMVAKQYSYLVNKYKVPADVVGKTMEKIEERDGKVTKESFLEESRPVSSPTHNMFEWNDAIAAEKYRLEQSSEIIRNIQIEIVEVPAKEVQLEIKTVTADELREQEEKKKSKQNKSENNMFDLKEIELPKEEIKPAKVEEKEEKQLPKVDNKNKVVVDNSSVIMDNQVVTDDQYFDDFFGDDE